MYSSNILSICWISGVTLFFCSFTSLKRILNSVFIYFPGLEQPKHLYMTRYCCYFGRICCSLTYRCRKLTRSFMLLTLAGEGSMFYFAEKKMLYTSGSWITLVDQSDPLKNPTDILRADNLLRFLWCPLEKCHLWFCSCTRCSWPFSLTG